MSFKNGVYCTEGGLNIQLCGNAPVPQNGTDLNPTISTQIAQRFSPIVIENMRKSMEFWELSNTRNTFLIVEPNGQWTSPLL